MAGMAVTAGAPKRTKKKGGKFVAMGAYGCVLTPAPRTVQCSEKLITVSKIAGAAAEVGKLFINTFERDSEIANAKIIAKIDPLQKCFVYPTVACFTTPQLLARDPDAVKCTIVNQNEALIPMLKMPYAGVSLLNYINNNRMTTRDFIRAMIPTITGLKLIAANRIIHQDIKYNNIMYYKKQFKLIDFGLMVTCDTVLSPKNDWLYADKWQYPPEYTFYVQYARLPQVDPRFILSEFLGALKITMEKRDKSRIDELIIPGLFSYGEYEKEFIKYYAAVLKNKELLQKNTHKVDTYSMGITLLYILQFLEPDANPAVNAAYKEILKGMLRPDARKRSGPAKVLSQMTRLAAVAGAAA